MSQPTSGRSTPTNDRRESKRFVTKLALISTVCSVFLLFILAALFSEWVGSVEDIDKGMVLGTGHPMGPFTLLDFVGIDTTYYIAEIMFNEYREARYAPPPLLKRMMLAGFHGKKSGKGFYDYASKPPTVTALGL